MAKIKIMTDSACDISKEIRDEFDIKAYIPGHIHFDDGRDFETTLDWKNISREEFYKALSNKKKKIKKCVIIDIYIEKIYIAKEMIIELCNFL